ncbi:S8 family serine peptidase [Serinibacter arcticus]|uniref:Putative secreted peptidase n=1 Tax=Serinibacter arcticus TaxID=1655435 RepID=A0A4Z1EBB5_9MICO|nr:S8 family serine peptidase [Serinibacter arcticus]TGO06711.1 putative secreted peptidase [Serinibacter arcticus]
MTSPDERGPRTGATGRTIVVLDEREGSAPDVLGRLGVSCVSARDVRRGGAGDGSVGTAGIGDPVPPGSAVVLDALGIAILADAPPVVAEAAADPGARGVVTAEPEVWVHTFPATPAPAPGTTFADTALATWGLIATGVATDEGRGSTAFDGAGVLVAVLDTGIDERHPDLAGRVRLARSFVAGEAVQDGNGHGTHVAGTIGGPASPVGGQRRYGVAPGCDLLIGKVLGDAGSGTSGGVLEGMNWAIEQGAHVISMSLGSAVAEGEGPLRYYEAAARAALRAGTLIIAAAGNDGDQPVGSPANCPSVLAVAALDHQLVRAEFSCIAINGDGGELNLAAPGVGIYSAFPLAQDSYATLDGTSMATPHVSGLAALAVQAAGVRGQDLWNHLVAHARPLTQGENLVGRGLAVVPLVSA